MTAHTTAFPSIKDEKDVSLAIRIAQETPDWSEFNLIDQMIRIYELFKQLDIVPTTIW